MTAPASGHSIPPSRILFDLRVPMRDGVALSADVYLPAGALSEGRREGAAPEQRGGQP